MYFHTISSNTLLDIQPVNERDVIVWLIICSVVLGVIYTMIRILIKLYPLVNALQKMLDEWPNINGRLKKVEDFIDRLEFERQIREKENDERSTT